MPGNLTVTFDHAQQRIDYVRLTTSAGGMGAGGYSETGGRPVWDGAPFQDCWIDSGITNTIFLRPQHMYPDYWETNTGSYAKLARSAFTLSGAADDWNDPDDMGASGPWIEKANGSSAGTGITAASYSKNRGFLVGARAEGGSEFLAYKFGWNSSASDAAGVAVHLYSSGRVIIYKDGSAVGEGKATSSDIHGGTFFYLMLLPCRHRELLVHSYPESGFSHVFDEILEDDSDPTITGATNFWFEILRGGMVQIAPVVFPASGHAHSHKLSFAEAPASSEVLDTFDTGTLANGPAQYQAYGHPAYVGTQTAVASLSTWSGSAFSPNGSDDEHRIKLSLTTSDTGYTPSVYGSMLAYPEGVADTDDSDAFDATASVIACSLSVPDDPSGVAADILLRDPEGLEADVGKLRSLANRPVLLELDDETTPQVLLDGWGGAPEFDDDLPVEAAERLDLVIRDRWKALEHAIYDDLVVYDGVNLAEAIELIVRRAGISAGDLDLSTTSFRLPESNQGGDWGFSAEPGDTAAQMLDRLMKAFAHDWVYGFRPKSGGTEFFAKTPADLGTTPAATLYSKTADAETAGDATDIYTSFQIAKLEPEANDVWVWGQEPGTGRPIASRKQDSLSLAPGTAVASRPDNWVGERRPYAFADPGIISQAVADEACERLFARLSAVRVMAEWRTAKLLKSGDVPLWRGDCVELDGQGTFRITSLGAEFLLEDSETQVRDVTYTGEKVA